MKWFEAAARGNSAELQRHIDRGQTINAKDALLREQDAYVPMFNAYENKGKLVLEAFPEDTLKPANVERCMMVVYRD